MIMIYSQETCELLSSLNIIVYIVLYKIDNPMFTAMDLPQKSKWWLCNTFDEYESAEKFVKKYFNSETQDCCIKEFLCSDSFHKENIMNRSRFFEQEYMDDFKSFNIVDNILVNILKDAQ